MQALKAIDSGEAAEDSKDLSGGVPSYSETKELSPFKKVDNSMLKRAKRIMKNK
jgi:hypothetical protein